MTETIDTATETTPAAWLAEMEAYVWALRPEALTTLVAMAYAGAELDAAVSAAGKPEALRRGRPPKIRGGVATVPLKGVMMPGGGSLLGLLFGIPNPLDVFREGFRQALANEDVGAIVMDIDSPGGVTDLIPEAAQEIYDARGKKPIIAAVNPMAASAGYWLASQADEVVTTPSGITGSIGVYAVHRDLSKMQDEIGIKTTLISAGKYKVEGNPFEPLDDDARKHIQEDVNYFYDLFAGDVARGRGVEVDAVKAGYGEGRALPAKAAKSAKLVDRVETLDETVARLVSRSRPAVGSTTAEELDSGADETVTEAEAVAGADSDEHARLLARLEGHALLQDRFDGLPV